MNQSQPVTKSLFYWTLCLVFIIVLSSPVGAQKTSAAQPQATPTPTTEKNLLANILKDQKGIWTAPFHLERSDARWIAPLGLSMAALMATDAHTSAELVENGDNRDRLRISKDISYAGSLYSLGGLAATFYLTGRMRHDGRAKETGLLAGEALINSTIVSQALKGISGRQRPQFDNGTGEFLEGGSSFPSGHAINSWAVATVIASEYGPRHPEVRYLSYGLATVIGISRYTGRRHFLSDVLAGSAMGYGIGRYVYRQHHDVLLDGDAQNQTSRLLKSRLIPNVAPIYSRGQRAYGAALAWSF